MKFKANGSKSVQFLHFSKLILGVNRHKSAKTTTMKFPTIAQKVQARKLLLLHSTTVHLIAPITFLDDWGDFGKATKGAEQIQVQFLTIQVQISQKLYQSSQVQLPTKLQKVHIQGSQLLVNYNSL